MEQNAILDIKMMSRALELAVHAEEQGEVPVGALITIDNEIIAEGWNRPITDNDPTAHAEIVALRQAGVNLKNYRLPGAELFVTLEPCVMCAGAIIQARLSRVIYGAPDPRVGAAGTVMNVLNNPDLNHLVRVTGGVLQNECAGILQTFFQYRRPKNNSK